MNVSPSKSTFTFGDEWKYGMRRRSEQGGDSVGVMFLKRAVQKLNTNICQLNSGHIADGLAVPIASGSDFLSPIQIFLIINAVLVGE